MFQIKKILFPVDFSDSCLGAARYAEVFAGRFQAELTLLHVVDTAAYKAWGTSALFAMQGIGVVEEGTRLARHELNKFLKEELKHLDVKREIAEGDPGVQIVAAARLAGTDLIMLPTHGLSTFRRYILGSIAAKVLHDADCPVWTGAHLENAPALEEISFPRVLCAIDLGAQSENTLRWADAFSQEHGAELVVVHVVSAISAQPLLHIDKQTASEIRTQVSDELRAFLEKLKITARTIVVGGEPAKAVGEIAQSEGASLVVIARGSVTGGLGRLRTHSYAIIRSSPCPVVSV
jgi:nucleotide-binding universal stress UspA family protein